MKRSKIIAERDRQRKKEEREAESLRLLKEFQRLKSLTGGFARSPSTKSKAEIKRKLRVEQERAMFGNRFDVPKRLPAKADPVPEKRKQVRYEGDMLKRELQAQEQTKLLKNRVGPLGNKMGNQYMTDTDYEDFKKGLLRRR